MVVLTLDDFKQNCSLLENTLGQDMVNPHQDLANLKTWVTWIKAGLGTEEHDHHFYCNSMPKIVKLLLKRELVRVHQRRFNISFCCLCDLLYCYICV